MRGHGIVLRAILVGSACLALAACGGKKKDDKKDTKKSTPAAGTKTAAGDTAKEATPSGAPASPSAPASGPTSRVSGLFSGMMGKKTGAALTKVDLSGIFKKSQQPSAPAPAMDTAGMKGAVRAAPATDLWSLAPDNAAFGLVIADGTLATADRAFAEIERVLRARSAGLDLLREMKRDMAKGSSGFDLFKLSSWLTTAGMDPSKGGAVFMATNQDAVLVLPVTDPAAFQKAVGDTKGDFGDKHCVMASPGRYVCAEKLDYAKAAAASKDPPIKGKATSLPAWLQGDIQFVAHLPSFPNAASELRKFEPALTNIGVVAATARVRNGAVSVRGWLEGKRSGPVGALIAALPDAKLPALAYGAVNYFHARIPMSLLTAKMPPQMPLPGGVDVRADLFDNMTGEFLSFSRGKKIFAEHAMFGLKDPARAAKAIDALCAVLSKSLPKGVSKPSVGKGYCTAVVDVGGLLAQSAGLAPFVHGMPQQEIQLGIAGDKLLLVAGERGKVNKNARTYGDPGLAKEFLSGKWNLFHWGMAFDPFAIAPPVLRKRINDLIMSQLGQKERLGLDLARWLYAHIYESGMGIALRQDGIYLFGQITTMAADEPAIYRAHQDAFKKLLDGDFKAYAGAVMATASKHPNSLAGRHAMKMREGVPLLGQFGAVGLLTLWGAMNAEKKSVAASAASPPPLKVTPSDKPGVPPKVEPMPRGKVTPVPMPAK